MPDSTTRPVGGTEFSWCKAVPGGTGVTVLGLLLSKPPPISIIQNTLHNLQNSHPILRSKIHLDASTNTFHFVTPSNPRIQIEPFDLQSTAQIIDTESNGHDHGDNHTHNHTNPFQILVEHEMNRNAWRDIGNADSDVIYASAYEISNERFAVFIRIHTAACDRAAAVALLRDMMRRVSGGGDGGRGEKEEEMKLAIEEMIPMEKRNKPFWARGLDMLGYSLNALRLGNLGFVDTESQRSSKVVRMQLNAQETMSLISTNTSTPTTKLPLNQSSTQPPHQAKKTQTLLEELQQAMLNIHQRFRYLENKLPDLTIRKSLIHSVFIVKFVMLVTN